VAIGLQRSGGIITSAAVIVIVVSLCFATADVILVKALGLGMALAVVIDATLVRGLLVPATMRLLGDWNWWLPFVGVQRHPPALTEYMVTEAAVFQGSEDAPETKTSQVQVGGKS
jgi:RND superfamily putative drug exporter